MDSLRYAHARRHVTFKALICALCAIGLYASVFMYRKSVRAQRGLLVEQSVVQSPRARALGGLPNALFGIGYYFGLGFVVLFSHEKPLWIVSLMASYAAAAFSAYLGYSLLFVTRMPCRFCWTAHAVNFTLAALITISYPK